MAKKNDPLIAERVWQRYRTAVIRGHSEYQERARRNEDFYLGIGRQWDDTVKSALEAAGKPWVEGNLIFAIINTILGYQTQTRLDVAYKPRESAEQDLADLLSKLSMHVLDQNHFPWVEAEIFADGMIQGRGYFDIRMEFDSNMFGNIQIKSLDPLDVIPDPDAKSYNPDDWADVLVTKWMTLEDVEALYGKQAAAEVEKMIDAGEPDFGIGEDGVERNKFGMDISGYGGWTFDEAGIPHVRIIERQYWKLEMREFFMNNATGDLRPIDENLSKKQIAQMLKENDYSIIKKLDKRVRWTVCTKDFVLHDDWSPYNHFTIIPFFPYFRRGNTVGIVDNLTGIQEMFNKVLAQTLHTINSTANSGWIVEENSLTNMDVEELEEVGAATGLILEYKTGRQAPKKIEPNQVPSGLEQFTNKITSLVNAVSGMSELFLGQKGPEVTGLAIQSRVQQNAIQLAAPIDNLYKSRHILVERLLELIQDFYTEERVFAVVKTNEETGEEETVQVKINEFNEETNEFLNDTTAGKYDVVVSDVPNQVTFQNAQFAQAIEMRKMGVMIPDPIMVKLSGLSGKNEIAKQMGGSTGPNSPEAQAQSQQMQAEMQKLQEDMKKIQSDIANRTVQSTKTAIDAAIALMQNPDAGPLVESILQGAGVNTTGPQGAPQNGQDETPEEVPSQEEVPEEGQQVLGGNT